MIDRTCSRCGIKFHKHGNKVQHHCSRQCWRLADKTSPVGERFFGMAIVRGGDECWGWNGFKDSKGYPRMRGVPGTTVFATHVSLELAGKLRPSNLHGACHTCDNPECTNPAHLWWGTQKENAQDAIAKGRLNLASLIKSGAKTRFGAESGNRRRTEPVVRSVEDAKEILTEWGWLA